MWGKIKNLNRRYFINTLVALARISIVPNVAVSGIGYIAHSDKLKVAGVGLGGKGASDIPAISKTENIVALCDIDWSEPVERVFKPYPIALKYKD